jgi:hypothetical protein
VISARPEARFGHNTRVLRSLPLVLALAAATALIPSAQAATHMTLKLTSITTVTDAHDTAPKGKANKGDNIDFKDLLITTSNDQLGKKKGKPVGYDAGTVLYTSATAQKIEGVTTFPGFGTVTFVGPLKTAKDGTVTVPITKGTGQFKGVTGSLIIGAGDQKAPNTYVLTLPHALRLPGSA